MPTEMNNRITRDGLWTEVQINVTPEVHDALGEFLFSNGCKGLVTQEMDYCGLKGYFPPGEDMKKLEARLWEFIQELREYFPGLKDAEIKIRALPSENWGESWKKFFKKKWVTPRLLIVPAWESVPELGKGQHCVIMDPGPAFGTGQHPTTMMCLQCLERFLPQEGWNILDVGTGSGILAIYAAKLGASEVLAIDNDLEAIRWAQRNVAMNGLLRRIEVSPTPIENIKRKYNLVMANLVMKEILKIMNHLARVTINKGVLILSGLMLGQVERITHELNNRGLSVTSTMHMNEWATVIAKKRQR